MPKIEEAAFAKLTANGKVYRAPLIAYENSIDGRWWRKDGMTFGPDDFDTVIEQSPEIVVLGVGFVNKVNVPEETRARFSEAAIELVIFDTPAAVERYNDLLGKRKVIGAFHLM